MKRKGLVFNIKTWNVITLSLARCIEMIVIFFSSTTCQVVSWIWPTINHMDVTVLWAAPVTVLQPTRLTWHVNEIINVARAHRLIGQLVNSNRHTSSMAGHRTMSMALFVVSWLIEHIKQTFWSYSLLSHNHFSWVSLKLSIILSLESYLIEQINRKC